MIEETGINKSALKALEVLKAMRGKSIAGFTNNELATKLKETPTNITRALNTLISAGLVEKWDDNRFRYSSLLLEIAHAHTLETQETIQRTNQLYNQVTANARALLNG